MHATTLKIEHPLLNQLNALRPKNKSLSAFVRELLEKEVQRQKMVHAANHYADFLASNPDEKEWLDDWGNSDLASPPHKSQRRSSR